MLVLSFASNGLATVYYWDPEGTSTAATNNLTGTWTTTSSQWSSTSSQTASPTTWPQSAAACFCAGSTTVAGQFAVSVNSSNIIIGGIYNGPLNPPGYNVVINGTGALILSNTICAFDTGGSDGDPTIIQCILAGTGPIQSQGSGGLYLYGANTYTGGFDIGGGGGISFGNNAAFGTGTITWQVAGFIQPADTAAYNIPNAMTHLANAIETYAGNTAGVTFSGPWALGSSGYVEVENIAGAITVSGPISGSANLTFTNKTGTTATWTLTGANTFTGALTNGLGNLTIGGTGKLNGGAYAGNIMTRGNFIYNSSASQNLSGVISGAGTITSAGSGTLTLSGANTYTGVTTNSGGILNLNHSETVNSSGPLGKQSDTVAGTLIMSGGTLQYSANNSHDYSGRMSTAANQQYIIDLNSRGITYASALVSSGGQLTLSDSGSGGVLTLNGTNTYTGNTTVKSGTLKLGATGSISQTPQISLASGATLDVSAAGITLTGSSPVQTLVASSSSGTATINATGKTVTLNSGAPLSFQANGTSSTVGQISVSGSSANLTLNNNTISVNITGSALGVGTYRLVSCAGTLTGAAYSAPTITGSGIAAGCIATIVTTAGPGGHIDLAVNSTGPTITTQPSSQTACYGQNAVFTVAGSGNGDSYYWLQHSNAGWGNAWTVGSAGGGTFLGTSTDNNNGNPNCNSFGNYGDINTPSGNSWGLYSTSGSGESLSRNFPSALTNGQVFQIDMDNGFIVNGVQCGFSLHSGANFLFSFYFQGGAANYSYTDSTGNHTTSVGYTQNGLRVTVVVGPGSPASYNLLVQPCGGSISTYSGTFSAAGSPSAVNLFNNNSTGGDNYNLYFNNLYAGGAYDNADNYTNNWAGSDGGDIAIPGENGSTFITNRTGGVGVYALAYNNAGVVGSSSATLSNTPKALSITGLTVTNKTYDGTTAAVLNGTVSLGATEAFGSGTCSDGLPFAGDSVSLAGTPVGTYNSKDVSTATNVTITGLSLTGANAANYVLTNGISYPATITPKPLSVAGTLSVPPSKVYDGTTTASVGGAAALMGAENVGTGSTSDGAPYSGDSVSLSGSVSAAAYNSKDVSTANMVTFDTSGLSLTGTDIDDYSMGVPVAQVASITALPVSLVGTRPYDGTTTAAAGILSVANAIGGDSVNVASGSGTLASANLGAEAISSFGTLALGNNSAGDYTLSGASGSVNITQAALTITANNQSKTYGQTVTFGSGSTNFTSSGLQNGDTIGSVTLAVSGNGGASNAPVSGSPYTITASAATGGTFNSTNYSITYNSGSLTVGPAALTVTADSFSRAYGETNPVFTAEYTNFVNGETLATSDVQGAPALVTAADTN
ncbi:MAG TPA: YDG domain-containing protein, partial [Verrucomicrobiae bacterium]|nr:YDG domain-containing protein [Verrucomicrobiae bacterium]